MNCGKSHKGILKSIMRDYHWGNLHCSVGAEQALLKKHWLIRVLSDRLKLGEE